MSGERTLEEDGLILPQKPEHFKNTFPGEVHNM